MLRQKLYCSTVAAFQTKTKLPPVWKMTRDAKSSEDEESPDSETAAILIYGHQNGYLNASRVRRNHGN